MEATMDEEPPMTEAPSEEPSSQDTAPPAEGAPAPLGKRLEGIVELVQSINQLLEELSLERRAEVSSKQWETWEEFKSSPARGLKPGKFWQNSIFARIYFVDKDLDECFHNVVKHGTLFFNHLNAIHIKLQLRGDVQSGSKRHAEDSGSEVGIGKDPHQAAESGVAAGDASNRRASAADKGKDIEVIRQSFANLIKAKIDFDMHFLNFNGILGKSTLPEEAHCLPEISGHAGALLAQSALTSERRRATAGSRNKRLRRKAVFGNIGEKSRKRLRRSARIASEEDSGEVQVIRSLRRRDTE